MSSSLILLALLFCAVEISAAEDHLPLPPKVIYHYGQYGVLMKDVQARTIPKADWIKYVMGSESRFHLMPYRRGFYGTSHPGFAVFFGDLLMKENKQPWFIAVEIADSCRQSSAVGYTSQLPPLKIGGSTVTVKCDLVGTEVSNTEPSDANQCSQAANQFFESSEVKVILDEAWPETIVRSQIINQAPVSWYLRDRNCIKTVHGNPDEVISMIASIPGFWMQNPVSTVPKGVRFTPKSVMGESDLLILIRALNDGVSPVESDLEKIGVAAAASDLKSPEPGGPWIRETVPVVINAYRRCGGLKATGSFKALSEKFLALRLHDASVRTRQKFDLQSLANYMRDLAAVCRPSAFANP